MDEEIKDEECSQKNTKKLVIKTTYYNLNKPAQVASMAKVLKQHIIEHKLYTPIAGKNYVMVEGWQFAGGIMGIFPKVKEVENLSTVNEIKWKVEVEIIERKTDKVVSSGFAICSNKEGKKKSFDEYAILSMAQTRAIGKAYRNLLGWVMKLAGYEATPSEEMIKVGDTIPEPQKEEPIKIEAECSKCGNPISSKVEKEFSLKVFKKILCRDCQKEVKKK